MRFSSRKCACRRELNSHGAAEPRLPARRGTLPRCRHVAEENEQPDFSQGRRERRPVQTHKEAAIGGNWHEPCASWSFVGARTCGRTSRHGLLAQQKHENEALQSSSVIRSWAFHASAGSRSQEFTGSSALQGAQRHAKPFVGAADAEYRDCSSRSAERLPERRARKYVLARLQRELMPNPSFKPSPNGGPPGPVRRYAVHFRQPGPGVPPSVPA